MRKKLLSVLLSLVLVLSLAPTVAHAMSFPDVDNNSDYAKAIEYISELKIMVGDSQGNFNPDKIVSRAEMATIICRMLGKTENLTTSNVFTDVPINHWANAYIGQAAASGIVGGYGNGKFGPSDTVTYEQAVTMVIRAINKEDSAINLGGYPTGYLLAAEANGLLKGIQSEQGQGLVRSSVAVLLYNYYTSLNNSATPGDDHIHNYVEKTIPGTGGHYEQVQVGTEKVLVDTQKKEYSKCLKCGAIAYTNEEALGHYDPESPYFSRDCILSRNMIYTEYVPVYEEQPIYENKWVEDSPTTIRVCEICGIQEQ